MVHHLPQLATSEAVGSEGSSGMYARGSGEGDDGRFQSLSLGLVVTAGDGV
jgi:hypothetical protein